GDHLHDSAPHDPAPAHRSQGGVALRDLRCKQSTLDVGDGPELAAAAPARALSRRGLQGAHEPRGQAGRLCRTSQIHAEEVALSASSSQGRVEHVLRIAYGYMATQILVTSNELGVFELLRDGPKELSSMASSLGVPAASLERLLAGCSSLELLERRGNAFALTPASSDHLIKDKPTYLGGMLGVIGKAFYPLAGHLIDGIR